MLDKNSGLGLFDGQVRKQRADLRSVPRADGTIITDPSSRLQHIIHVTKDSSQRRRAAVLGRRYSDFSSRQANIPCLIKSQFRGYFSAHRINGRDPTPLPATPFRAQHGRSIHCRLRHVPSRHITPVAYSDVPRRLMGDNCDPFRTPGLTCDTEFIPSSPTSLGPHPYRVIWQGALAEKEGARGSTSRA